MKIANINIWRYLAIGVGVVFVLLWGIQWGISRYLHPIVAFQLQSQIQDASENMYELQFDHMRLNLISEKLHLENIHIHSNQAQVVQRYEDCELSTHNIFELKIPRFTITGIGFYDALINQQININNIELCDASIRMLQLEKRPCPIDTMRELNIGGEEGLEVLDNIRSIVIGGISVRGTHFEFAKIKGEDTLQIAESQRMNVRLSDLEMAAPQYMGETFQDLPIKAGNITFEINGTTVPLPKSRHNLGIAKASFSLEKSLLELQSLQLIPKKGIQEKVQSLEVDKITFNTADFFDGDYKALMQSENWSIPAIELNEPKIILKRDREEVQPRKDWKNSEVKSLDFQKVLSPKLSAFGIKSFKINNASLKVLDAENEEELLSIYPIHLSVENFKIDHSLSAQTNKIFYADDFKIKAESFRRKLLKQHSTLAIDQINLDMVKATASMKNVAILPDYTKVELGHLLGHRVGWTRLQNMNVFLKEVDINSLLTKRSLNVKKILISNLFLESFMDQRLAKATSSSFRMPQEVLEQLPMNVHIDNIELKDSKVEYTAYGAASSQMGVFTLENLNGSINNVTNNDWMIQSDSKMTFKASTRVMGKGLLNLDFKFPLNSSDYTHTFSGALSEMDMTAFNSILETVPAQVNGGKINKIIFSAVANDKRSRGKLQFYYNDLKFKFKDKTTGEVNAKQDIISFFADKLFLRNDNPKRNGNFREGVIDYERDTTKSIVNFWWKSVLTGIMSSVSSKSLVNEDNSSAKVLDKLQKRQKKKARRKERRKQLRKKIQRLLENPFK